MTIEAPVRSTVPTLVAAVIAVGCLVAAVVTRSWVLTAVPVGLLFGFFLQKADLCGSSSFSEALMFKDWRKLGGLGVIIVVSMVGFALLDATGMIKLNPKPLQWASALVGGTVFGVGTVLAGGCVSGALFKCGQGNLNSVVALLTMPVGISAVIHGPLKPAATWLDSKVVPTSSGGPVTLPSLTGLPYWSLALVFLALTIAVAVVIRRRAGQKTSKPSDRSFFSRPWKPWQAGLAIGVLGCAAYLSSAASGRNYPLGVTHGVMHVQTVLTDSPLQHAWKKPPPPPKPAAEAAPTPPPPTPAPPTPAPKKIVWWLLLEVCAVVLGSFASAKLDGKFRLLPKPPDEMLVAAGGGILVGIGAAIAGGCVVGNIMSGYALMSVGNILFGITTLLANWAATYVYLMGGLRR